MTKTINEKQAQLLDLFSTSDLDQIKPGSRFDVTWTLRNNGEVTWDENLALVFTDENYPGTADYPHTNFAGETSYTLSQLGAGTEIAPGDTAYLTISFNATHAEDRDKRPGIGHYPWPKVTDGMYEDLEMPLPRLNDPAIYEEQPEFLKQSINRQRYFWRWDTPEKYQTNMRAYFRMISGIDHVVGRLVAQLEEQGLVDNTVIIYTADNGYYLGDRGFAGKWTHYDQSLRVPLIVHDPRLPEDGRGRVLSELALNSDLASTMIALAGLPVPDAHTGRSLLPLLEGKTVADWRTDFLCEFLAVPGTIPRWEGVRDTDWVYARYFVNGADKPPFEFLHDLENDPDQLTNLALSEKNAPALKRMRARCDELVAAQSVEVVAVPQGAADGSSDPLDDGVADIVTVAVVDGFEVIQIDGEHGESLVQPGRALVLLAELIQEVAAIAKAGESVRVGEPGQLIVQRV